MSEPTEYYSCPNCGKNVKMGETCSCVSIVHKKEGEGSEKTKEELQTELDERNSQLEIIAMKDFENDKKALLKTITDEKRRDYVEKFIGEDPERMEQVKFMMGVISTGIKQAGVEIRGEDEDGTEKVPPSGARVRALSPESSDAKERVKEEIDKQFSILTDPSKSQDAKDLANQKINELYQQFRAGARASGKRDKFDIPPTMNCPKCKSVMQGIVCQECGYEIPKIQRD